MLSLTWNAPIEAFTREGDFFEGKDVDAVYMPFHKLNEFIGLTRLPTFTCNDVVKNPQVEQYFADYQAHLKKCLVNDKTSNLKRWAFAHHFVSR